MKLTSKQRTKAITKYARRHGYFVTTVRNMTSLLLAAIKERESCYRSLGLRKVKGVMGGVYWE